MTTVCFLMRGEDICGFDVSGHTGTAKSGSDILCAAISSAAYLTANTVTDVIGARASVEVSDGLMSLLLNDDLPREQTLQCQVIFQGFKLHIKQLRQQHPKNIRIINIASGKEHYNA